METETPQPSIQEELEVIKKGRTRDRKFLLILSCLVILVIFGIAMYGVITEKLRVHDTTLTKKVTQEVSFNVSYGMASYQLQEGKIFLPYNETVIQAYDLRQICQGGFR